MADAKITALTELAATPDTADILPIVDDPAGTPATKKITVANLMASKADVDQTMYIGTTAHAINRASAAEGLAGITSLTPGVNFTLSQNSVNVLTSEEAGAIVNTLYLKAGNIGIGTTSPEELLDVAGNLRIIAVVPRFKMNANGQAADNKKWRQVVDGLILKMDISNDAETTGQSWLEVTRSGATISQVAFPSGNVGIGTTGPGTKLEVIGGYVRTRDDGTGFAFLQKTGGISYFGDTGASLVSIGNSEGVQTLNIDAGNVGIGTTTPTNLLSLGGNAARIFWMERHTTANTAGNTLTITAGGATAAATDKAGGALILQGGLSTGSAESGVTIQGCVAGVSGTADRTQTTMIQVLGNKIGFYGQAATAQQTGVAVTAAGIHAALVSLGLITS